MVYGLPPRYNNIAPGYKALGEWDDAIHASEQALKISPNLRIAPQQHGLLSAAKSRAKNEAALRSRASSGKYRSPLIPTAGMSGATRRITMNWFNEPAQWWMSMIWTANTGVTPIRGTAISPGLLVTPATVTLSAAIKIRLVAIEEKRAVLCFFSVLH